MPVTLSIVGTANSGKTTLISKLIPLIREKGFKVGVIKHTAHGFQMDHKGKDSWKHQEAGADAVMVASDNAFAMVKKTSPIQLEELEAQMGDLDLIITEGYKQSQRPKLVVHRKANGKEPLTELPLMLARVGDEPLEDGLPHLSINDPGEVARFIVETLLS